MTQSEKETIDVFCCELSQALERITGKKIDITACMEIDPNQAGNGTASQGLPDNV